MNKPNNYEQTQASGEWTPINLGGHIMIIKKVEEMQSKTNKPMIKVMFDFAQNDSQAGYFMDSFKNDIRPDKKWPSAGTTYILTDDENGNCSRQFKTFTTLVEKSNPGFTIMWGNKFADYFKGKLIGGVFGTVEEEYNGKCHMNRKLRWFRSIDGVKDAPIPEEKLLARAGGSVAPSDGFMNIPDGIDEELPFA